MSISIVPCTPSLPQQPPRRRYRRSFTVHYILFNLRQDGYNFGIGEEIAAQVFLYQRVKPIALLVFAADIPDC